MRTSFTVGAMFRREVRRLLRSMDIAYSEDKGWLDSHFVVSGDDATVRRFLTIMEEFAEQA